MTPCESLGNNARYLDALADTTPSGLLGTPFGVVCDALRVVAASVWNLDPTVYRAGIAWAWYLGARPSALAVDGLRALLCAALVSECAPLVRESQTVGELVALLSLWMDYRPTFADMEALFATYGVRVDVRAISDPEGHVLMPVDDTRLAFYIFVLSMDWSRPMLLGDIAETARRASPLGARPFVLFYVEGLVSVPVAPAPTDGFLWVDVWESAVQPIPPTPVLPTVDANEWLTYSAGGGTKWFSPDQTSDVYYWTGSGYSPLSYDSEKAYSVVEIRNGANVFYGRVQLSIFNNSGVMAVRNVSDQTFESTQSKYAVCSSNQANVVKVYDSQNTAYNAFKFTASGTDYYYVLDGVQADWTDDLAGIGYSLTPAVITAYFTNRGSSATSDTTIHPGSSGSTYYALYDASGTNIDNDSSKTYTFYKAYRYDGTEVGFSSTPQVGTGGYWYLDFHVPGSGWSSSAFRIEYTVS